MPSIPSMHLGGAMFGPVKQWSKYRPNLSITTHPPVNQACKYKCTSLKALRVTSETQIVNHFRNLSLQVCRRGAQGF